MPLRTRIIIMVGAGIFVIAVISAVLIFKTKTKPAAVANNGTAVVDRSNVESVIKPGIEPTIVPKEAKVAVPTASQKEEITVRNQAEIFVERYHTYSSENNYQNIRDVQSIVTDSFWKKISAPLSVKSVPTAFVSLTTEVISVASVEIKNNTASVLIKTRKTSLNAGVTTSGYGEYIVSLNKVGDAWLVSGETGK